MNIINKISAALLVLFCALPVTQAATYNFTITGNVLVGDEFFPNAYNLTAGENVTATGTFTANLGTIGSETGTVSFANGSGNSMTINLNGTFLFAANDDGYGSGSGPSLSFTLGALTDFDFQKTGSPSFNSSFLSFDDFDSMYGEWTNVNLTAVPVPAAVWLFGSGLVSLMAIGRRKKIKIV